MNLYRGKNWIWCSGRHNVMFLDMIGNMVGVGKGRWVGIAVGV